MRSARALKALNTWNRTKVVKASVSACASPRASAQWNSASVPAAITRPMRNSTVKRPPERILAPDRLGGSCMRPGRPGSTPRLMAGGPSMMMLIHKSWMAVNGVGRPSKLAPSTAWMAPMLVES